MRKAMKTIISMLLVIVLTIIQFPIENYNAYAGTSNIPKDAGYYNGHYYYIYRFEDFTWEDAKVYCESLGGYLATITTKEENDYLYQYVKKAGYTNAYFGFTDKDEEGVWKWVTGECSSYTNWNVETEEPDNGMANGEGVSENYAMFYFKFDNEKWNDGDFGINTENDQKAFICEWGALDTVSIPNDAGYYNGHYYYVYDKPDYTWEDAKAYCESKGGYLATITSEGENNYLYQYIKKLGYTNAYFGFTDKDEEGVWKWVTGEKSQYTNWASGEPNNERSTEKYALFYYKYTDGKWNDGDFGVNTVGDDKVFICEWGKYSVEEDKELSSTLIYDQYRAKYYSNNASMITDAYMTYSEIEDNYEPTQYAINNILSFGWKARFGFEDSAKIWETLLLDILLKTGSDNSSMSKWEDDSVQLCIDMCNYLSENNLADVDKSISLDSGKNVQNIIKKLSEAENISYDLSTGLEITNKLMELGKTWGDTMKLYAQYVELEKMINNDMVAFIYQLRNTNTYRDIPAFQRAIDTILNNISVDSYKLFSLVIQEKTGETIIKKAVNWTVGKAVEWILGGSVLALIDITKATTIHLMNTICGTDELSQINVYIYMLNRIDAAASEAFKKSAKICLESDGKREYQSVNGGLQFIINLYNYGINICRRWGEVISTNILTRISSGVNIIAKRKNYDMATAYYGLNRKSSKEEKTKYLQDRCDQDEKYLNNVLKNQYAFAMIQMYNEKGDSGNKADCIVIFKVENPNGGYSLYTWIAPKNAVIEFPKLPYKKGYITPSRWYKDLMYNEPVEGNVVVTENVVYHARYISNVLFDVGDDGAKLLSVDKFDEVDNQMLFRTNNLLLKYQMSDAAKDVYYEIPAYIDGYELVELGDCIFKTPQNIKKIYIPPTIKRIGNKSFEGVGKNAIYKYVEGSMAQEWLESNQYENTISEKELVLREDNITLKEGENRQLSIEKKGSSSYEDIFWKSSNDNVVKVVDGKVYALKKGMATVTATTGRVTVQCRVYVEQKIEDETEMSKANEETSQMTQVGVESTQPTQKNENQSQSQVETTEKTTKNVKIIKRLKNTKIKKIKAMKKSLRIMWFKHKNVKGYQIQYSTSKRFKGSKVVTIKKARRTSKTIKGLKAKKRYYVRIRTYIIVNGNKKFSKWSKIKSKKTK